MVRDRVCLVLSPGLWGRRSQRFVYPDGRPACTDACLALTSNRAHSKQNDKVVSSLSFTLPAAPWGGGGCKKTYHRAEGVTWLNRVQECPQ